MASLHARSLSGLPEVRRGDDVAELIASALALKDGARKLCEHHVLVIAHKVVSKAEGAVVSLADVKPTPRALEIAAEQDKDARAVQVVLEQSREILRAERGVLISRTHHGFVCANAGVDSSNAARAGTLVLLPHDPDASARRIRTRLGELTGTRPAVLIADSFGRAWRHGQCDVLIGCAGFMALDDWRGRTDSMGMQLQATWLAVGDAACATADLARTKDSREPVVLIEGLAHLITSEDGPGAAVIVREVDEDLFR